MDLSKEIRPEILWGDTADTLMESACQQLFYSHVVPSDVREAITPRVHGGCAPEVSASGKFKQVNGEYRVSYEREIQKIQDEIRRKEKLNLCMETSEKLWACTIWTEDTNEGITGGISSIRSEIGKGTGFAKNDLDTLLLIKKLLCTFD